MCFYIPLRHAHCGCTTFELEVPNPCHKALRNCIPCPYIPETPSRPVSLDSAPSLTTTVSTASGTSFQTNGSKSSLIEPTYETYQQPPRASTPDDIMSEESMCGFHEEDCQEMLLENSGNEMLLLGRKAIMKRRKQRLLRRKMKMMRLKRKRNSPQKKRD